MGPPRRQHAFGRDHYQAQDRAAPIRRQAMEGIEAPQTPCEIEKSWRAAPWGSGIGFRSILLRCRFSRNENELLSVCSANGLTFRFCARTTWARSSNSELEGA